MEMHFATLWEQIAAQIPQRTALIHGERKVAWGTYQERAACIAQFLHQQGLGHDSKMGLYLYNSPEYMEAQFAGFKIRGVPVNVNYRYLEDELVYLLDNSDSEALFFHGRFAERIANIRHKLPKVRCLIQVDDGSGAPLLAGAHDYEQIIRTHAPMAPIERGWDDTYMLYTGGTTGMPKGVMYKLGEMCAGFLAPFEARGVSPPPATIEETLAAIKRLEPAGLLPVTLVACPLMHGTGMWLGAMMPHNMGGTVVTLAGTKFDADELWAAVQRERVTDIVIVGDAFAKPMLDALRAAQAAGRSYDISSVRFISSSGVMWTQEVKAGLLEFGDMILNDGLGSTEGGMGRSLTTRANIGETAKFQMMESTKVFDDNDEEVKPGSGAIGMIAQAGRVPTGYYKDPEKSAKTFRTIRGLRYSFPGDFATVEADGTIRLLGRGSMCINTMGEKVYPEEVEEAIKTHPAVYDCLVVGVKDPKYGERVAAVVSLRPGQQADQQTLIDHVAHRLAGYKKPRNIFIVDEVQRASNGKADYKWARSRADEEARKLEMGG